MSVLFQSIIGVQGYGEGGSGNGRWRKEVGSSGASEGVVEVEGVLYDGVLSVGAGHSTLYRRVVSGSIIQECTHCRW